MVSKQAVKMVLSNFPRQLLPNPHRLLSTTATTTTNIWNLLRSHSPPPPLETILSNSIPNPPTPALISSIMTSSSSSSYNDQLLSLRFFVWADFHSKHRHSASLYSSASSSLRLDLNPQLLHSLLDSYASQNYPFVYLKTFKILFNLICHSNLTYPFALSVLRRMPEFGCYPDVPIYNSMLKLPSVTHDDASFILDEIRGSGLRPDVITYVSVIKKLCEGGRIEEARRLTVKMEEEDGCLPNVVVYSALLDGACSCGDLDAGFEILERMEGNKDRECGPNVVSYTCLMKCLCDSGRLEEALEVLERMERYGCRPNRVTMRTLIKGFCDKGKVKEAYQFFDKMVANNDEKGGISSKECYSLLVFCLLRVGDRETAEELFGRMLERGVRPDGLVCNTLLREICGKKSFLDGYNWVCMLVDKGMNCIDSDVYSCLLAGLCVGERWVEAVKLGRMVVENEVRVEDSCVDSVVEAMEKICEGDLASQIVRIRDENKSQLVI